jgi:hypothetical protein
MIALQEYRFMLVSMLNESVDRFARPVTAINVITQEHVDRPDRWKLRYIRVDERQQLIEQVQSAMDIADCIDTKSGRQ